MIYDLRFMIGGFGDRREVQRGRCCSPPNGNSQEGDRVAGLAPFGLPPAGYVAPRHSSAGRRLRMTAKEGGAGGWCEGGEGDCEGRRGESKSKSKSKSKKLLAEDGFEVGGGGLDEEEVHLAEFVILKTISALGEADGCRRAEGESEGVAGGVGGSGAGGADIDQLKGPGAVFKDQVEQFLRTSFKFIPRDSIEREHPKCCYQTIAAHAKLNY
jgi:hypothetical protein